MCETVSPVYKERVRSNRKKSYTPAITKPATPTAVEHPKKASGWAKSARLRIEEINDQRAIDKQDL